MRQYFILILSIIPLILSFHFQVRFPLIWQHDTSFGLQIPKTSVSWLLLLGEPYSSSIRSPKSLRAWGRESSKYLHCLQTTEMLPCILDRWHMRVLRAAKNSSLKQLFGLLEEAERNLNLRAWLLCRFLSHRQLSITSGRRWQEAGSNLQCPLCPWASQFPAAGAPPLQAAAWWAQTPASRTWNRPGGQDVYNPGLPGLGLSDTTGSSRLL